METVMTIIKIDSSVTETEEFQRLFPNAELHTPTDSHGESIDKDGSTRFYIRHDKNIKLTPYHKYTLKGLCKKLGIVYKINPEKIAKWKKLSIKGLRYAVRIHIADYLGPDFKCYFQSFNELLDLTTISNHPHGADNTLETLTTMMMDDIRKKCGSMVYKQVTEALSTDIKI